jgi:ribosomal protein L40E
MKCSGCKNEFEGEGKTCTKCRERARKIREAAKQNSNPCVFIKENDIQCTFKRKKAAKKDLDLGNLKYESLKFVGDYCGKHLNQVQKKIDELRKIKRCTQNGCHNILPNNEFSQCSDCRGNNRVKDKARLDNRRSLVETGKKICVKCGGKNTTNTLRCTKCREYQVKADKKRDATEERKQKKSIEHGIWYYQKGGSEKKKFWRSKNHERCLDYSRNFRAKLRALDEDEYLRKNTELMKKYRKTENWQKWRKEIYKKSIGYKFSYYKDRAKKHKMPFRLSLEECIRIFTTKCHYCGCEPDIYQGIDRLDSRLGYTIENTVPACSMCNYMKGGFSEGQFILICCHIFAERMGNLIEYDKRAPGMFNDYIGASFSDYKYRSIKKINKSFSLTKEAFNNIVMQDCYLCGKSSNEYHRNGIDRIDNNLGYTENNCAPCCADCNYMKKDYSLENFDHKIHQIWTKWTDLEETFINHPVFQFTNKEKFDIDDEFSQ